MTYSKEISAELVGQDVADVSVKIRFKEENGSQEHEVVILLPKPRTSHRTRHLWFEQPLGVPLS